ncbi:hypothetical protein RUM4293_01110 [Ruegeria atlantica]|uniref:Uncharacterized protein n=1 Tax=Ruegeria atlantica TaxID=81569 RepID=A0A0P1E311_9RHOB|nr:hypothetical protein RUM4293_01110 [Ruegeria atlantica]
MNVCWDLDRNHFTQSWAIADLAFSKACRSHGRHGFNRANQLHKIGDVVRAEVEDWAAAWLKKEVRVRVPGLHSMRHDMACAADDLAHLAAVDCRTGRLMGTA